MDGAKPYDERVEQIKHRLEYAGRAAIACDHPPYPPDAVEDMRWLVAKVEAIQAREATLQVEVKVLQEQLTGASESYTNEVFKHHDDLKR